MEVWDSSRKPLKSQMQPFVLTWIPEHDEQQWQGWSGGDYETGTGSIKGTQYSWWQRHLKPQKQFESEIAALQKSEPHYDEHGNEVSPVKGVDIGEGNPMSFRGPGFYRMSP